MKKAIAIALLGACLAGASWAQTAGTNTVSQNGYYFNAKTGAKTDANGNAAVTEASKDRDYYTWTTLINNQVAASGTAMADSNVTPVATYQYNRMGLMIYGTFDSLSTNVRLAIQVRAHPQAVSDSINTFAWSRWRSLAAVTAIDSLGHEVTTSLPPQTLVQSTSATGVGAGVSNTEFIVRFNFPAMDDSTAAGNGKPFRGPKGVYIPLTDNLGTYYWAPYTSVRVRTVNGVRNRFRVRVDLVGTAK